MNSRFQKMSDAFARKLAAKSAEQCQRHPPYDAVAWSMQEVVEHLVLTYRGTVLQTEKYRQRGSPSEKKGDWKQTSARLLVVGLGYFPRGAPAPEFVLPGRGGMPEMNGESLAALIDEELTRLDAQLDRCEQVFGSRPFAPHFRFGQLSARQWRRFHLVHGQHHLAQLGRIEKQIQLRTSA